MRFRTLIAPFVVVTLSGCGSVESRSRVPDPARRGCGDADVTLINGILGTQLEALKENILENVTLCAYAEPGRPLGATLRYLDHITQEEFERDKQGINDAGQPTTDIPGIGDEAYTGIVGGSGVFIVVARKDDLELTVTAGAPLAQVTELTRVLVDKAKT